MNNIHGARINMDMPGAAGLRLRRAPRQGLHPLQRRWSQIVNLRYDQDGCVYMIDWYDKKQCHNPDPKVHDRSNGRIFKIVYGDTKTTQVDLRKLSDAELVKLQLDKHEWLVRTARRVLQERTRPAGGRTRPRGVDRAASRSWSRRDADEIRPAAARPVGAARDRAAQRGGTCAARLSDRDAVRRRLGDPASVRGQRAPADDVSPSSIRLVGQGEATSPVVRLYLASAALHPARADGRTSSPACSPTPRTPGPQPAADGLVRPGVDRRHEPQTALALALETKVPQRPVVHRRVACRPAATTNLSGAGGRAWGRSSDEGRQLRGPAGI